MNMCLERTSSDVEKKSFGRLSIDLLKTTKPALDEYDFVRSDYKVYSANLLLSCSPIIMFGIVFIFAMIL